MSRVSRFYSRNASAWLTAQTKVVASFHKGTCRSLCGCYLGAALALLCFAAACTKKAPVQPPPPPAPAPSTQPPASQERPAITFSAEPSSIQKSQSALLRWQVQNATDMSIDSGVGPVGSTGQKVVYPNDTTTYTLTARGPGGSETKEVTVNVSSPPPPPPPPPVVKETFVDIINHHVKDIYFDYDKSDIRDDARAALTEDADGIKRAFVVDPTLTVTIEGNCDERGSAEYNLALGDRRATAAKEFLIQLGVPGGRLNLVSNGKEKPVCTDATEDCYQRNRHDHFAPTQ